MQCRNLIKKPWAFIRVPYMKPTIGSGFLNQVPTLRPGLKPLGRVLKPITDVVLHIISYH